MPRRKYHGATRGAFSAMAEDLGNYFEGTIEEALSVGIEAAHDATFTGYLAMLEIIETSITKTGEERAQNGGHPGRIDSGNMHDDVNANTWVKPGGEEGGGNWGWLDGLEDYYLFQELGGEAFDVQFAGMKALQGSYVQAREDFLDRLTKAGFKVT